MAHPMEEIPMSNGDDIYLNALVLRTNDGRHYCIPQSILDLIGFGGLPGSSEDTVHQNVTDASPNFKGRKIAEALDRLPDAVGVQNAVYMKLRFDAGAVERLKQQICGTEPEPDPGPEEETGTELKNGKDADTRLEELEENIRYIATTHPVERTGPSDG